MAAPKSAARKPRKNEKKNIAVGQAHNKSTCNNTIVAIRQCEQIPDKNYEYED